jgi:SAM-dependent methyltransferase
MKRRTRTAENPYRADLAYIHDAGFGHFAEAAAAELLGLLRSSGLPHGLVVELGCGSGILSERLSAAEYSVVGFDISADMVELARRRVPKGTFHHASYLDADLARSVAVTAVGEIFNYLFDRRSSLKKLAGVFRRVHEALAPGGVFLFDVATPGRVPGGIQRGVRQTPDWVCVVEAEEDAARQQLTRRITTFRKAGQHYRRDDEVHRLRLYEPREIIDSLRTLGFSVRRTRGYGGLAFPPGWVGFVARKRSS